MTTTVRVWSGTATKIGHTALRVEGEYGCFYLSWYPKNPIFPFGKTLSGKLSKALWSPYEIRTELDDRARGPAEEIVLKGLDEAAMVDWFKTVRISHYTFLSKNCARLVAMALMAGGADRQLASEFERWQLTGQARLWAPYEVRRLARTLHQHQRHV